MHLADATFKKKKLKQNSFIFRKINLLQKKQILGINGMQIQNEPQCNMLTLSYSVMPYTVNFTFNDFEGTEKNISQCPNFFKQMNFLEM